MECQCQHAHPAIDLFDPFSFDKHFDELFPPAQLISRGKSIMTQAALEILNSSSPNGLLTQFTDIPLVVQINELKLMLLVD
jgi:hypothetical protein